MLEQTESQVEQQWLEMKRLLEETREKITMGNDLKQFYGELEGIQRIIMGYEKWISTVEKVADEALELHRQMEQCRVSFTSKVSSLC